MNNPNVNQRGQVTINSGRQVIVPRARFNCSGRITNIAVSMSQPSHINIPNMRVINLPLFQVWHPTSFNSSTYNKIGEVQLPKGDFVGLGFRKSYYHVNLQINSSSQIEFHSGDVIGYYQPSDPLRLIGSISTTGYTSYSNIASSPSTSIDINNVNNTDNSYQPLIEVLFGKVIRLNPFSHKLMHPHKHTYMHTYMGAYTHMHTHMCSTCSMHACTHTLSQI